MNNLLKQTVAEALTEILGDRVTEDDTIRKEHGAGFSYHANMPPDIVVYPRTTEEVAAVVQVCAKHQTAVIPFGAGTSVLFFQSSLQQSPKPSYNF